MFVVVQNEELTK